MTVDCSSNTGQVRVLGHSLDTVEQRGYINSKKKKIQIESMKRRRSKAIGCKRASDRGDQDEGSRDHLCRNVVHNECIMWSPECIQFANKKISCHRRRHRPSSTKAHFALIAALFRVC